MLRKLRIAFSGACGVVCLLLVVLWVHSYWYRDLVMAQHPAWGDISMVSLQSKVSWIVGRPRPSRRKARFEMRSIPIALAIAEMEGMQPALPEGHSASSFTTERWRGSFGMVLPYWFLILSVVVLAGLPWLTLSKRFSLRTLLFVTTIVAVLLGAIVYAIS
jgi:hypothetical protein